MSHVTIHIDLDNDVFRGNDCGPELACILRKLADSIQNTSRDDLEGHTPTPRDINGNQCGSVLFEFDDDEVVEELLSKLDRDLLVEILLDLGDTNFEDQTTYGMERMLQRHIECNHTTVEKLRRTYCLPY